jgi:hypothetical protein
MQNLSDKKESPGNQTNNWGCIKRPEGVIESQPDKVRLSNEFGIYRRIITMESLILAQDER